MAKYITNSGDRWDSIAHLQLGNTLFATNLMEANLDHIDITIFPAGIELTIPDVVQPISSNLPPWKRSEE